MRLLSAEPHLNSSVHLKILKNFVDKYIVLY